MENHLIHKAIFVYSEMVVEIKKPVTKEKVLEALSSLKKEADYQKSLRKHFGKLKRDLNPLDYQKQMRDDWVYLCSGY